MSRQFLRQVFSRDSKNQRCTSQCFVVGETYSRVGFFANAPRVLLLAALLWYEVSFSAHTILFCCARASFQLYFFFHIFTPCPYPKGRGKGGGVVHFHARHPLFVLPLWKRARWVQKNPPQTRRAFVGGNHFFICSIMASIQAKAHITNRKIKNAFKIFMSISGIVLARKAEAIPRRKILLCFISSSFNGGFPCE